MVWYGIIWYGKAFHHSIHSILLWYGMVWLEFQKPTSTLAVLGDQLYFLGIFFTKTYAILLQIAQFYIANKEKNRQ